MAYRKLLGVLGFSVIQLFLWTACTTTPTQSPIQLTATALQGTFGSQNFLATQQSLFMTAQASGGQGPFLIVTSIGIPVTVPPQATLQALTAQPCIFLWTTQDLPDLTSAAQNAFAGVSVLADVTVHAQAYGENCIDPDGTVRYFSASTTDFYLSTEIDSVGDLDAVAQIVLAASDILNAPLNVPFPAKLGYLDLTVIGGEARGFLHTPFDQIVFSRAQGLTGGALIDALGGVVER